MSEEKQRMKKNRNTPGGKKKPALSPIWLAGLAIVIVAAVLVIAMLNRGDGASSPLPSEVSASEAFDRREAGAFILDVREPEEWEEGHIPGATLIPLGELEGRVDELPRDREIVVACRSGNRSKAGRDILVEAGFTQVTSMSGGLTGWKSAGYPTVAGK